MKKQTKLWLIVACTLFLVGSILFIGGMTALKWNFKKLSTVTYETRVYTLSEDFQNIVIKTKTADIAIVPSENDKGKVVCYEMERTSHIVGIENDTLMIQKNDARKWYDYIGFNFDIPKITIYLPRSSYGTLSIQTSTGDVRLPEDFSFESIDISASTGSITCLASASEHIGIRTSTGNIRMENASAGTLDLSVSTGKITLTGITCAGDATVKVTTGRAYLTNLTCQSLTSKESTGSITLENVMAEKSLTVKRSTGGVRLDRCDAAEILITTDTGDVKGSLRSDKVFVARSDTGRIDVPKTLTGGRCEITTDTGDITITIAP